LRVHALLPVIIMLLQREGRLTYRTLHSMTCAKNSPCDGSLSTKRAKSWSGLVQQLDPEDLRDVVRAYQASAAEVIQQYEGRMAQYLGDGLLIYFAWPQAHENDAQRALHASLGIVEAITANLTRVWSATKGCASRCAWASIPGRSWWARAV
jgi:hypothetical protein